MRRRFRQCGTRRIIWPGNGRARRDTNGPAARLSLLRAAGCKGPGSHSRTTYPHRHRRQHGRAGDNRRRPSLMRRSPSADLRFPGPFCSRKDEHVSTALTGGRSRAKTTISPITIVHPVLAMVLVTLGPGQISGGN